MMRTVLALALMALLSAPASAFFPRGGSAGPPPPPVPWYDSSWGFRKTITVDHTKVAGGGETYVNFVVEFSETTDASLAAHAQTTGNDILFTKSDGTKLNHEIESYTSATGNIVAWVQVAGLSTTVDTTLYMFYGNPAATNQQSVAATWDSHYKGVYHLAAGTTGYTLTQYGSNPVIPAASQPWHIAQTFDPHVIVDPLDATKLIWFFTGQAIVEGHESIGRGTSPVSDPLNFTDYASNPIISITNSLRVSSILVNGTEIDLFVSDDTAQNMRLYVSTDDGFTFTEDAASPVLVPSGDENWVSQGDVFQEAGACTMYYSYRTASAVLPGIRYATSTTDCKHYAKGAGGAPNTPDLITRGPAGSPDSGNFELHQMLGKFGSLYLQLYDCVNGVTPANETPQMCFMTSASKTSGWTRAGAYPASQPSGIAGQTDQWQTQCGFMFAVSTTWYLLSCNSAGQPVFTSIYQVGAAILSGPTGTPVDMMTKGVVDSTGQNSLVGSNLTAATGQIDGGATFDGHYSRAASPTAASAATANYTMQAWVKLSSLSQNGMFLANGFWGPDPGLGQSGQAIGVSNGTGASGGNHLVIGEANVVYQDTGYTFANTTAWHSVNAVNVSGTTTAYVDNTAAPSAATSAPLAATGGFYIGQQAGPTPAVPSGMFAGAMDEVRFSDIVRSAGWLTTEYTMESAPGSFYSVGPEVPY